MQLRLPGWRRLELRWWWEGPAPSAGPLLLRDAGAARQVVAALLAHPENHGPLRRFLLRGAPGRWAPPDDAELLSLLATALSTGRATLAPLPAERLTTWGSADDEAAPASAPAPRAAVDAPPEEVCWPCLKAAASARALREASASGAPFVEQG